MTTTTNGKSTAAKNRVAKEQTTKLKPIQRQLVKVRIRGTSPLIQHAWTPKTLMMIRDKHAGKKSKNREIRDPEAEGQAAMYVTEDGRPGLNVLSVKAACISAAHKDIGIEKTLVRKSLFIRTDSPTKIEPLIISKDPFIREDCVRVGQGSTDLRYRPQFDDWAVDLTFEIDADLMQVQDLVNLLNRAGFGVGVGEWRPEKGGEYGRFEIDTAFGLTQETL